MIMTIEERCQNEARSPVVGVDERLGTILVLDPLPRRWIINIEARLEGVFRREVGEARARS